MAQGKRVILECQAKPAPTAKKRPRSTIRRSGHAKLLWKMCRMCRTSATPIRSGPLRNATAPPPKTPRIAPGHPAPATPGTPSRSADAGPEPRSGGAPARLPWGIAGPAVGALLTVLAMRLGAGPQSVSGADGPVPSPAPDISQMSPEERATRLFDRVMILAQAGKQDSVAFFLPMAVGAYQQLP